MQPCYLYYSSYRAGFLRLDLVGLCGPELSGRSVILIDMWSRAAQAYVKVVLTSASAQLLTCTAPHSQSFEQGKVSSRPVLEAGQPHRSRQVFETWSQGLKSQPRSCDTL